MERETNSRGCRGASTTPRWVRSNIIMTNLVCGLPEATQHLPPSAQKGSQTLKAFFELAYPFSKDNRAIGVALYVHQDKPGRGPDINYDTISQNFAPARSLPPPPRGNEGALLQI